MGDGLKRARAATRATRGLPPETPKLGEIAERIAAHLRRFEASPTIARVYFDDSVLYRTIYASSSVKPAGSRLAVRYIGHESPDLLTKATALGYHAWLDAGNVGRHWEWAGAGETAEGESK